MDWITGIQRAVDYVEAHILEPIDYEETARQAYSSSFHFQRVFCILCGFTLGDYIRMRRLSMAGYELSSSGMRVTDAALKYGYDTLESFSRAFTRFHGISPSQAKLGGAALKSFSPLFIKLVLEGGSVLDYRVETKEAFPFVCRKMPCDTKEELSPDQISRFWQECNEDRTFPALRQFISKDSLFKKCIAGASLGRDASDKGYPYAIGVSYHGSRDSLSILPPCLSVEEIPAHTYLVFSCIGKMPEAFEKLYHKIYSEFLPASQFIHCGGADFEVYPSSDIADPGYACEFWIAVEKKTD